MDTDPKRRRWDDSCLAPRVLIEGPAHDSPEIIGDLLEREGYQVATCTGPSDSQPCDLLSTGACALVDESDVVVNLFHSSTGDEIASKIASLRRPPALVIESRDTSVPSVPRTDDPDIHVVRAPITRTQLATAVERSLERGRVDGPPWGIGI